MLTLLFSSLLFYLALLALVCIGIGWWLTEKESRERRRQRKRQFAQDWREAERIAAQAVDQVLPAVACQQCRKKTRHFLKVLLPQGEWTMCEECARASGIIDQCGKVEALYVYQVMQRQ